MYMMWRDDDLLACVVAGEGVLGKGQKKKPLKKIISASFFIYSFFFPVYICTLPPAMKDVLICLRANIKLRFL